MWIVFGIVAAGVFWFFSMYKVYERTRMVSEANSISLDPKTLSPQQRNAQDFIVLRKLLLEVENVYQSEQIEAGESIMYFFDDKSSLHMSASRINLGQWYISASEGIAQEVAYRHMGEHTSFLENAPQWFLQVA